MGGFSIYLILTMDIKELYALYLLNPKVVTDTRNIHGGEIFFALKGPSYNGNEFAERALESGASFAVTDERTKSKDSRIIKTENVLLTLQLLAKHHRKHFNIPFIAITGSNGKTTTKELVSNVLSTKFITYATLGNLNNHIGVPLTILKIQHDAEIAVIEMGANHQREIESYCHYTLPTHGLITNCGKAHLEGFGGIEGVIKGKGELFQFIKRHNGCAFVNNFDPAVKKLSSKINQIFSYGPGGDINGKIEEENPFLFVHITTGLKTFIRTNLIGSYNLPNILAAVTIGKYFKVPDAKIIQGIENYSPTNNRSQLLKVKDNEIILDAYNANPTSMKAAIENFSKMGGDKKVLLLGSMMELGKESKKEHSDLIEIIDGYNWHKVVLVGQNFNEISHQYIALNSALEAKQWLIKNNLKHAKILIKGSRNMEMEKILE